MPDFIIVTDSASDLNSEIVGKLGIKVVSLCFTIGDKLYYDYPDRSEMSLRDFYHRLRNGGNATTNAVNVNDYTQMLEPILSEGKDVLIIVFSSGLSSTYNSAEIAAKILRDSYPQRKILVIDSLCASMGQGLLVQLAVRQKENGKNINEVYAWVRDNRLKICHHFTVGDLGFLRRGGRISGVSAVLGGALSIKPVLHVNQEGLLINIRKVRGRKASLKALVEKMNATAYRDVRQTVFIGHADCGEDAELVADMVREGFPDAQISIDTIGPVIGAHTGPDTVTLFYQGEPR